MIYIQYSDSTEATIISYFGAPQDPDKYPNQGVIETSDARWATFYNSLPEFARAGLPPPAA